MGLLSGEIFGADGLSIEKDVVAVLFDLRNLLILFVSRPLVEMQMLLSAMLVVI